ncbi:MAG: hypothetical protein ABI905_03500 [Betaproteobacteria bacterium]
MTSAHPIPAHMLRIFIASCLLTAVAHAQTLPATGTPPPTTKPKTYALAAALGNEFAVVSENINVFSHIENLHYARQSRTSDDDILNRMALESLDKVIAGLEPQSKRVYLRLAKPRMDRVDAAHREEAALTAIRSRLRNIEGRSGWDRIVVVTPAYRLFDHEGLSLGSDMIKLEGFGVFTQRGGNDPNPNVAFSGHSMRVAAFSPRNGEVKSHSFIAPFSYVEIWVLDAKDLSLIDKQIRYDHQKLADPYAGSLDVNQSVPTEFLARQVRGVIEGSIREAVMQSKLNDRNGVVEVGPLEAVKAGEKK